MRTSEKQPMSRQCAIGHRSPDFAAGITRQGCPSPTTVRRRHISHEAGALLLERPELELPMC
eukprot:24109-Eustigmatos_ZCMA.PRE.1